MLQSERYNIPEEWQIRNTVGPDRVQELTELYEELGYEVKVESYKTCEEDQEACSTCLDGGEYFIILTRRMDK